MACTSDKKPLVSPEQALSDTPGFQNAKVLRQLAQGASSNTWLIEHLFEGAERKFVLRLIRHDVPESASRFQQELSAIEQAAAAGITPALVMVDATRGLLIREYAEGRVWQESDLRNPDRIKCLAELLVRLHSLPAESDPWSPGQAALTYAGQVDTRQACAIADEAADLYGQLQADVFPAASGEWMSGSLCHNDLMVKNIVELENGAGPCLIDWEFAAAGDPLFDLAVVCRHHSLPSTAESALLGRWSELMCPGLGRAEIATRVAKWGDFYDALLALWYLLLQQRGEVDSLAAARLKLLLSKFSH